MFCIVLHNTFGSLNTCQDVKDTFRNAACCGESSTKILPRCNIKDTSDMRSFQTNGVSYMPFVNTKCFNTSDSIYPMLPTASVTMSTLSNIKTSDTPIIKSVQCTLVDYVPRFSKLFTPELPDPSSFPIFVPPVQTGACALLEWFETISETLTPDSPVGESTDFTPLLVAFANEHRASLGNCISYRLHETDGSANVDTFNYREAFPGVKGGPALSQLWMMPISNHQNPGFTPAIQHQEVPDPMSGTYCNLLKAQQAPHFRRYIASDSMRLVAHTKRWLSTTTHSDALYAWGENVIQLGNALEGIVRYSCTNTRAMADFVTCAGCVSGIDFFIHASTYALHGAFSFKKNFNRVRPEIMATYVQSLHGNAGTCFACNDAANMGLPAHVVQNLGTAPDISSVAGDLPTLLASTSANAILNEIETKNNGCLFVPMLFPEGAPTHDAYPGGHSTFSGSIVTSFKLLYCLYENEEACQDPNYNGALTLLKWNDLHRLTNYYEADELQHMFNTDVGAYYNGPFSTPAWKKADSQNKYDPCGEECDDLTVVGELHKFAWQYTHSRDFSGVHYAADGCAGMRTAEALTLEYAMHNMRSNLNADLAHWMMHTLDGRHIHVFATHWKEHGSMTEHTSAKDLIMTSAVPCATDTVSVTCEM